MTLSRVSVGILTLAVSVLIFTSSASAYTISPIKVDPAGSLVPCTPVNVTFFIDNPPGEGNDFPGAVDFEMSTDLYRPHWFLSRDESGKDPVWPQVNKSRYLLSETNLAGNNSSLSLSRIYIRLTALAPRVEMTSNKTLIGVSQIDADGNAIPGSNTSVTTLIINTCCISLCGGPVSMIQEDLEVFRSDIDTAAAEGIDTSSAEEKYSGAQLKITSAMSRPSTQLTTALNEVSEASAAIHEGEQLLGKARAQKEVADAQEQLDQLNEMIRFYQGNSSTASIPDLESFISASREAEDNLTAASQAIQNGNYSLAHSDAKAAYQIANASYFKAFTLDRGIYNTPLFDQFRLLFLGAGMVVILILIGGIFWWKRRNGKSS